MSQIPAASFKTRYFEDYRVGEVAEFDQDLATSLQSTIDEKQT